MRVVSYYPDALLGEFGTASSVRAWCGALAAVGADVRLVVDRDAVRLPAPAGVDAVAIDHGFSRRLRVPRGFAETLAGADVLVLNGAGTAANVAAGRVARRLGIPYVVTAYGVFHPRALARRRRRKELWNLAVERRHLRRALAVHLFFPEEETGLAALGVDLPVVTAPTGWPEPNGTRWRGEPGGLLWLGRFDVETKGLDLLLQGLARVPADERPRLRLFGPDWRGGKRTVTRLVSELGLGEWVAVEEPVYGEQKSELLTRSGGLIHPSRWDACPTAVLEAASVGAPILTTPHPLGRFLASRGAAVLADADPASLAQGLGTVCSPEAAGLGAKAAEVVRTDLAWPSVAGAWLRQVDDLLARAA